MNTSQSNNENQRKRSSLLEEIRNIKKLIDINAKNKTSSHFSNINDPKYKGHYEIVYSNFQTKKYYGKDKKKNQKGFSYNQNMIDYLQNSIFILGDQDTNQNTINNNTNNKLKNPYSFPCKKKYSVTARLYNYGFFIKNKLQRKRIQEAQEEKNKKNYSYINPKSLFISYNMQKQKNKKTVKKSQSQEEKSFHPILDHHSLEIANNLEPSYVRLMEKKHRKNTLTKSYSTIMKEKQKSRTSLKKSFEYSIESVPSRIYDLYEKGVKKYRNINNSVSNVGSNKKDKKISYNNSDRLLDQKFDSLYKKQIKWKERIDKKTKRFKKEIEKEDYEDCTFHPQTLPYNLSDSLQGMNINAMNNYIEQRRKTLRKKEEDFQHQKKVFFEIPRVNTKTKVKYNGSQTMETIEINKKTCMVSNNIRKMRKLLNLEYFFSEICHNKDKTK